MSKDPYQVEESITPIKALLLTLGLGLICGGVSLLIYFVFYVFQIIEDPESVALFDYLQSFFPETEEGTVFFEIKGASSNDYLRAEFSKAFGVFGVIFMVVIGLSVFGGVVKTFIYSGIKIIIPIIFPEYAIKQKDEPFFKHNKNKDYAERL